MTASDPNDRTMTKIPPHPGEDLLYGMSRDQWAGTIHAYLLAMPEEKLREMATDPRFAMRRLADDAMNYWLQQGYSYGDIRALASLQTPGGFSVMLAKMMFYDAETYLRPSQLHPTGGMDYQHREQALREMEYAKLVAKAAVEPKPSLWKMVSRKLRP